VHTRDADRSEPAAIAAVADFAGKCVLEVGCGDGRLTTFAAERAAYVYAFDPKGDEVAKAKRALSDAGRARVIFAVHDAEALNVERRRFDLALCGWSL
jgi:ubiquinone/menaquinone biosynthesis C-methylase UbiE